jgi:hypothetical protein
MMKQFDHMIERKLNLELSNAGLVTWPFCGQITRFWLFYFLFGLEKYVWPFGSILAFFSSDSDTQ